MRRALVRLLIRGVKYPVATIRVEETIPSGAKLLVTDSKGETTEMWMMTPIGAPPEGDTLTLYV